MIKIKLVDRVNRLSVRAPRGRGRPKKSTSQRLSYGGVRALGKYGRDTQRKIGVYNEQAKAAVIARRKAGKSPYIAIKNTTIPETTARRWIDRLNEDVDPTPALGAPPLLSQEDEELLVQFTLGRCEADACVDGGLVIKYAHDLAIASGRLKKGDPPPSTYWLNQLAERHPKIALREGQRVSEARRQSLTEEQLQQFEDRVKKACKDYDITETWQVVTWDEIARRDVVEQQVGATGTLDEGEQPLPGTLTAAWVLDPRN